MYICICVCCYSIRLAVVYVPSISSIALSAHSKIYGRVYDFPVRGVVFYLVTRGFTSAYYVRIQSIDIRRHIERRHVNREEFRASKHRIQPEFGE